MDGDGCTEIGKKAQAEEIKCVQSINVYLPNASRHHIHTGRTESLFTVNGLLELLPLSGGSSIGPPQGRSHLETNCRISEPLSKVWTKKSFSSIGSEFNHVRTVWQVGNPV